MKSALSFFVALLMLAGFVAGCAKQEWTPPLHEALKSATRLRVRSGGTCHRQIKEEKTLLDLRNTQDVIALIQQIKVDSNNSGFHCMCCGEPTLEFYKDENLIASLGFHHGHSLRWLNGRWKGDAFLTESSAAFVVRWLADHGVSGPKQEVEEDLRLQKKAEASKAKWLSAMPQSLKPYWQSNSNMDVDSQKDKMLAALTKEFPVPNQRVCALLRWYGSGEGSWSGFPSYEDVAEQMLLMHKTAALLRAIEESPLDDAQTEGAARLFGGWTFSQQRPADLRLLSEMLKQRLLEHSLKSEDDDKRGRAIRAFGKAKEDRTNGSNQ